MMTRGNQNGQDTEMEGEGELNIVLFSLNKHTQVLLNALPEKVPTQGHNIKQAPSSKKGTLILLHVLKYYAYTENLFLLPL